MTNKKNRYIHLDFIRFIALFHMIFHHSYITMLNNSSISPFTNFLYEIIPLCPAIFLFVTGFLCARFFKNETKVLKKRAIKYLLIMGVASVLFVFEHGFQFVDMLFAPGILYTIGITSILITLLKLFKNGRIFIIGSLFVLTGVFIFLRLTNKLVFPLTTGYEPYLPTMIFGIAGAAAAEISELKNKRIIYAILAIISAAVIVFFFAAGDGFKALYTDYGRYSVERIFSENLKPEYFFKNNGVSMFAVYIWNYDIKSFIMSGAMLIIITMVSFPLNLPGVRVKKVISLCLLPSKYALVCYFTHLSIIAAFCTTIGYNTFNEAEFYSFIGMIAILLYGLTSVIFVIGRKSKKNIYQGITPE